MIETKIKNEIHWYDKEKKICDESWSKEIRFFGIRFRRRQTNIMNTFDEHSGSKPIGHK